MSPQTPKSGRKAGEDKMAQADKIRAEDLSAAMAKLRELGEEITPAKVRATAGLAKMDREVRAEVQDRADQEIALAEPYELPGGPANAVKLISGAIARADAAGNTDRAHLLRSRLAQVVQATSNK